MRVRLIEGITGWVNGVYCPQPGMVLDLDDEKGMALCKLGRAVPDRTEQREEAVVAAPEHAARPAKAVRKNVRRS